MTVTPPVRTSGLAMIAMILAMSMTSIDMTIVAIASPDIQSALSLSANQSQWIVNAYLVALAATFALGGRLADVWGRRRMVLVGIAGFAVTSALCGAAPAGGAEAWLIVARAAQGVFAAILIPAAISIVYVTAAPEKRGRSLAMFFGLSGAFTALGPFLGGYLLDWSWRAIFWINIPVALVAFVLAARASFKDDRIDEPVDWRGAILIASGMALSVLGFSQAPVWGWGSVATWACLVGGLALLVVFVAVQRRTTVPLVRLSLFRARGYQVDTGVLFFAMVAFIPVSYFLSMYAQISLGLAPQHSSRLLLQFFLGYLIAAQVGGRIFDARGAKPTIVLGCLVGIAGFLWWASSVTTLTLHAQMHPVLVAGAGIGLLLGPASADAVSRAQGATYGEVTGINQTVRNYGSAIGFAVLGTLATHVFASRFTTSLVGLGVPRTEATSIAHEASTRGSAGGSASAVPSGMREAVERAVQHDFAIGMQAVLVAMAGALVVALVIALRHPGDRPALAQQHGDEHDLLVDA